MKALRVMMRITDNQYKITKEELVTSYPKLSQVLLDRTLANLSQNNGIFVFPSDLKNSPDLEKDQKSLKQLIRKLKQVM